MNSFKENVIWLNEYELNNFPVRFENEIYYSEGFEQNEYEGYSYKSNFSIKYVIEGNEKYIINGKKKVVNNDQLLIVNNDSDVTNLTANGSAFSIFLNPEIINDCYTNRIDNFDVLKNNLSTNNLDFFDDVIHIDSNFMRILKSSVENNPEIIITQDYYYELAEYLIGTQESINQKINSIDKIKNSTRKELFRRVNMVRNYLDDNLNQKFDLSILSDISCLSKYQLIRIFKEVYHITPNRYFILKKLEKAKDLIEASNGFSISEIGRNLGYPDLFSFSKQFKQIHGISPSMFRERVK